MERSCLVPAGGSQITHSPHPGTQPCSLFPPSRGHSRVLLLGLVLGMFLLTNGFCGFLAQLSGPACG